MRKVVVASQFCGISPYTLSQEPITFSDLIALVESGSLGPTYDPPRILEVGPTYHPPSASIVFAEDAKGMVFIWRSLVDSSG